jgi:7-cyano-7-deazaguanine synthase
MIISLSGGADSGTLLYHLMHSPEDTPIQPVFFSYGQRHAKEEEGARLLAAHARTKNARVLPLMKLQLPLLSKGSALTDTTQEIPALANVIGHPQPPTYVPFRNLVFASMCLHLAETLNHKEIALGVHRSDTYGYWDTSFDFIVALETISGLNRQHRVHIVTPFLEMTKSDIICRGLALAVPYQWTWSCYRGTNRPCRECATCVERETAFEINGEVDPLLLKGEP